MNTSHSNWIDWDDEDGDDVLPEWVELGTDDDDAIPEGVEFDSDDETLPEWVELNSDAFPEEVELVFVDTVLVAFGDGTCMPSAFICVW